MEREPLHVCVRLRFCMDVEVLCGSTSSSSQNHSCRFVVQDVLFDFLGQALARVQTCPGPCTTQDGFLGPILIPIFPCGSWPFSSLRGLSRSLDPGRLKEPSSPEWLACWDDPLCSLDSLPPLDSH